MTDLLLFNVEDGFAESMVRGFRKGFITENQYTLLKGCRDLKEFKNVLLETDYSECIKEFNEQDITSLKNMLKEKLATEIDYLQSNCGSDLQNFIQIMRHSYMIDNVISIIECSKDRKSKDIAASRLEPLGYLPEITGLIKLDDVRKIEDLYDDVLIDTEVGFYFSQLIMDSLENRSDKSEKNVQAILQEFQDKSPGFIRDALKKIWLEYFYRYVQTLPDPTRTMMEELLSFEADCQAIQIIYNSIPYETQTREGERQKSLPKFGINQL
jgi:V-type H+-transporting ATPase subunit d